MAITVQRHTARGAVHERARRPGVWNRVRNGLLRLLLRAAPGERQRLIALTMVIGALCGLAAVAFHLTLRAVSEAVIDRAMSAGGGAWIGWTLLVPTAGALLCGIILQYLVPGARGSGIPEVKIAYARHGGRLRFRDAVGKFFVSALQIGSGSSLGREGPTVQICAGIAALLGRVARVSQRNLRRLLPVGAAAGIAAAFNAPIAAVTFTIEEIVGSLDHTVLAGVIVAAALAAVVERTILGGHPVLATLQLHGRVDVSSLLLYAVLGILAAGVSLLFTEALLRTRARFRRAGRLPAFARPAVGGLVAGALAIGGVLAFGARGVAGGGYETLGAALGGGLALRTMIGLCALKLIATVFSYGTGGAGGIFAPALFIGGMLGGACGVLDVAIFHHPATAIADFALVGMGAVFAGIIRAPITSVLIIVEMTSGYSLILPLMIANMMSYGLARALRPAPIYEALLAQDGVELGERGAGDARARVPVSAIDLAGGEHVAFTPGQGTVAMLEATAKVLRQEVFPVVDGERRLLGVITTEDLALLSAEPDLHRLVNAADVMHPPVAVRREDDLRTALDLMLANGIRQLPVIDAERRVTALIDEGTIARAYLRATPARSDASALVGAP